MTATHLDAISEQTWTAEGYATKASFVPALGAEVLAWLAPRAGERILDLGCGDGRLTQELLFRRSKAPAKRPKSIGLSLMSLGLLGFGVACSDSGAENEPTGAGGAASGGAESAGRAGSGGDAAGGSAGSGASGGDGSGGSAGSINGVSDGASGGGDSEFAALYELMEGFCRSNGYVAVELDLPDTSINGG